MEKIYTDPTLLIGHTPLLELKEIERAHNLKARIVAKLESRNPGGSVKDRAALYMIADAERRGLLAPGALIIEPTSGNTGIGLTWIARAKGYRLILTMPDTMSLERRRLLEAYGAEIVLTPGTEGMTGAIRKAEEIREANPGSMIMGQFDNPANGAAHEATTAPEIWEDTDGGVSIFVAGVGTGGTISGTGRGLKERNPGIRVVAVEPAESDVLGGGRAGSHKIQGIGAGFIPGNYDVNVVDEVIAIPSDAAIAATKELVMREGVLAGISSGAALAAAISLAERPENEGKMIVALFPDSGERYLSTGIFS